MGLLTLQRDLRACADLVDAIVEADRSEADGATVLGAILNRDRERRGEGDGYQYDTRFILNEIALHLEPDRRLRAILPTLGERDAAASRLADRWARLADVALYLLTALPYCVTYGLTWICHLRRAEPVLYSQTRFGQAMAPFTFTKFTTMVAHAETMEGIECLKKDSEDVRIIGRWARFLRKSSLNELPQRRSVRAGHLRAFGPRPYPERTHRRMLEMGAGRRNSVPPGWISLSHMVDYTRDLSVAAIALLDVVYADLYYTCYRLPLDVLAARYMVRVLLGARNR